MLKLMSHTLGVPGRGLARRDSNSSLPATQHNRVRRHRDRLSYSLRRIRGRRQQQETNQLPSCLPEELQCLAEDQTEFEEFTTAVLEDLSDKVSRLRQFKLLSSTSYHDRSYSTLQIFMLQKYSSRIKTFRSSSVKLIGALCRRFDDLEAKERLEVEVKAFRGGLAKMKTRMKHMIDVSDKYALVEIFDAINIFNKVSLAMDCQDPYDREALGFASLGNLTDPCGDHESPPPPKDAVRKCSESSVSSTSSSSSIPSSSSPSFSFSLSQEDRTGPLPIKTLRSLSDHVCVLSKTYVTGVYKRS